MANIFRPAANSLAKASLLAAVGLPVALIVGGSTVARAGYNTKQGLTLDQPVPFSHQHHATELGIDCRYCHTSVEKSSFAGLPPTHTCMTCHSQIWTNSPLLEPIRESYRTGTPIKDKQGEIGWNKVNKVPEFVYFNHSIHINRGLNCNICHGPVQKMQLAYKGQAFFMAWCLDCHRAPERFVRERETVFELYKKYQSGKEMTNEERALADGVVYNRNAEELEKGRELVKKYGIKTKQLTDCWVCHR
jgi:hypothetical protein